MPAGREGQGLITAVDAADVDGNLMAGETIFHLDGEPVWIARKIGRPYIGAKQQNVGVIRLVGMDKDEGQGSGKSVKNQGFMGKYRFNAMVLPAKAEATIRNAVGEGGENAVSHSILRANVGWGQISVDEVLVPSTVCREGSPAQERRALVGNFGRKPIPGNGDTSNSRACGRNSHREMSSACMSAVIRQMPCRFADHRRCGTISQWDGAAVSTACRHPMFPGISPKGCVLRR